MNWRISSRTWLDSYLLDRPSGLAVARSTLDLAWQCAALFALFLALQWWCMSIAQLPEASYFRPTIFSELGRNLNLVHLGILIALIAVFVWRRALGWCWSDIQNGKTWRPWILLIVFILAWTYASYDYNLYYGQRHTWDRILLVVLAAATLWRPVFLLPFTVEVIAIAWQFHYPLSGYSVAEQFVLVRILILFLAAFVLHPLATHQHRSNFAFLLLTIVASSYWWPGLGKLRLLWFAHGHPSFLLPAAYISGWLSFWEPERIAQLTQILTRFDLLIIGFTLLVECGALFFLWRRPYALALLCGWIALHLGIAAVSGIFFWKWILVNLGLLWLLCRDRDEQLFPVFKTQYFLLSLLLIGGSRFWYDAVNFSWYETRISYAYRVEAIGESGQTYALPPRFFSPYEYQFSLGGFAYLVQEPRLNALYGATWERDVADALLEARTAADVFTMEAARGRVRVDDPRAARFDTFMRRVMGNLHERRKSEGWFTWLQAPPQLLSFPYRASFSGQEPVVKVAVHEITSLFNEAQYLEIRDVIVREIEIPHQTAMEPWRSE